MERKLEVTWDDPLAFQDLRKSLPGLDFSRLILEGKVPPPPMERLLGFRLVEAGPGLAVFECTPGEQHYNPIGVVHGGLAMTMLDSCMGCAVNNQLPANVGHASLETKVNMVRAVTSKVGRLRATGRVLHAGKTVATAEGRLEDETGRLYAHGTTTLLIF